MEHYDVIVIGAGHAGIEAANISEKYGLKTALITKNYSDLGKLSCNPSIGGVGKTHIASEVDILGGVICKIGDKSAIHYRVLNLSKGPAVWGVRAQIDRDLYSKNMQKYVKSSKIDLIEDEAMNIIEKNNKITGVECANTGKIKSKAVILTTGTFLNGKIYFGKETKEGKKINDFARVNGRMMTNAEWNASGKRKAQEELIKEGGIFDGIITRGIDFSKGIEGRSRETWIEDVKLGIQGVDKGLYGTLERFKPETDLQGNESLSAWVNKQYQFRRGKIYNYYEANPLGESLQKKAGEGQTIGDRLVAEKDYTLEAFENKDLSKEFVKNKRGDFKEVVKVPGERKLENELPVDNKVFNEKGGWKETIVSKVPEIKNKENASYKNIGDLAPNFTFDLVGAKLTPTQKKNPNDFNQVSLKNLQDFVSSKFKQPVMEESVGKNGEKIVRQKLNENGEPVFRNINIGETSADLFRDATVKFDKGVSDKIQGTSNFKRLGVLGDLYHKANAKEYTAAEMKNMGYDVNPKPDASGAWRVASGPGGNIFIRGKSKGKDITAKDVMEFLGQKPDGTFKTLSEDRALASKSRRFIDEIGAAFSSQQVDIAVKANPNIVGEVNSARFLLNTSAGRSRKIYSEALAASIQVENILFINNIAIPVISIGLINQFTIIVIKIACGLSLILIIELKFIDNIIGIIIPHIKKAIGRLIPVSSKEEI